MIVRLCSIAPTGRGLPTLTRELLIMQTLISDLAAVLQVRRSRSVRDRLTQPSFMASCPSFFVLGSIYTHCGLRGQFYVCKETTSVRTRSFYLCSPHGLQPTWSLRSPPSWAPRTLSYACAGTQQVGYLLGIGCNPGFSKLVTF